MKILAIGNSFSEDSVYYLHQIAAADGVDVKVVNLFIGGCSLEHHWKNIRTEAKEYQYQLNGVPQDRYVSVQEALDEEDWDYITTQQSSHDSGWEDTYEPFLHQIIAYLREKKPQAKILLNETWAYEIDSDHDCFPRYNCNQQEMYQRLSAAYRKAARENGVRMIPCGDVIQKLRTLLAFDYAQGGLSLCRDGFHMNCLYGRYALAATWYMMLCGGKIKDNSYIPRTDLLPGEVADAEKITAIKEVVTEIVEA